MWSCSNKESQVLEVHVELLNESPVQRKCMSKSNTRDYRSRKCSSKKNSTRSLRKQNTWGCARQEKTQTEQQLKGQLEQEKKVLGQHLDPAS